jgi:hypothetical protein
MKTKIYLGDSVYLAPDDCESLVLTTENGLGPSNTIILEPAVCRNLLDVLKRYYPDKETTDAG